MIWHILKKDLKLLWMFGSAIAAIQFAIVAVHLKLGHFEENDILPSLLFLLEMAVYFGTACLIAALVHQDAIVGTRQDWLVRPIKRSDLLAAKLLFLLLFVQLPMLLADIAGGLANGFALSQSLPAALSQNLYMLIGFTLPILAFVSLTKSMTEALGGAFVIFIGIMGLEGLITGLNGGSPLGPTTNTGIAWIPQTGRFLIYLLGGIVILALQYFRRKTRISRLVLCAVVALCLLTQIMPWRYAYSWEKSMSRSAAAGNSIALRFDSSLGRFQSSVAGDSSRDHAGIGGISHPGADEGMKIYIPLQISGMPSGSILKIDRAVARIAPANGGSGRAVSTAHDPGDFEVQDERNDVSPSTSYYEPIRVRGDIYNKLKDTPIALEVDYSITVLKLSSTNTLVALDANRRIANVGWCQTRLNDSRTAVRVRCLQFGNPPQCMSFALQTHDTARRNPAVHGCLNDYAPYFGRFKPPDPIMHTDADLYFRDQADLVRYPVDGTQIGNAQVVMKSYAAADHFTTRLVIPAIRLSDWFAP